jgi:acetyltransferase-like isoleucine patch superfamily enzyme
MKDRNKLFAKGNPWERIRSTIFLLPAWFAPHKSLRAFFHRLRGVDIGRNVEIGYYCIIGNVHPSRIHIGDHAIITANSVILEHDNSYYYTYGHDVKFGDVHIGEQAFLGIGTVVMPGVNIGSHAIVGALSFVKSDVPSYSVVAGQPAKVVKRFPEDIPVPEPDSTLIGDLRPGIRVRPSSSGMA